MMARRAWMLVLLLVAGLCAGVNAHQPASGRATVSTELNQSALQPGKDALIAVVLDLAEGFHAQSNKPKGEGMRATTVKLDPNPAFEFEAPSYPPGRDETYPELGVGTLNVYIGKAVIFVPVKVRDGAALGPLTLKGSITYQICDDHVCFQPETTSFEVSTRIVASSETVTTNKPELFAGYQPSSAAPPTRGGGNFTLATADSTQWSIPVAFGAAFLAGLLFNIMPCVLPVLPLKAIGFYEASHHHRWQSFLFGLVFSAGLVSVFIVLAMLVLVFHTVQWGSLFSHGWFIWSISTLLVLLAAGLMGGWNFQLPLGVYTFEPRHDTYSGNFFWGALMAILATPCTAPLLPPLLLWASSKPASIGVPAMVMVGVGMASPYLILSATPELARRFPRTGPFAELFKQMMGFMLLAAAAYFVGGRIVHGSNFWWVVTAVIAVAALFLLARTVQLSKSAGAVGWSSAIAVAMLGGAVWWSVTITSAAGWTAFSESAFEAARASGKPVLVKFTANWCATCQVIERNVYRQQSVWDELKRDDFVAFKVDLTDTDAPGKDLLLKLNPAGGIPLTAIYPPRAESPIVLSSIYSAETLLDVVRQSMHPQQVSAR